MWKETRATSSSLEQALHTARLFAGAAKRLQEKHGKCAEALTQKAATDAQAAAAVHTPSVLESMMLFHQAKKHAQDVQDRAKAAQDQVKAAKKVALEAEKDNDAAQKELEELQRVMELKRARTNAFS